MRYVRANEGIVKVVFDLFRQSPAGLLWIQLLLIQPVQWLHSTIIFGIHEKDLLALQLALSVCVEWRTLRKVLRTLLGVRNLVLEHFMKTKIAFLVYTLSSAASCTTTPLLSMHRNTVAYIGLYPPSVFVSSQTWIIKTLKPKYPSFRNLAFQKFLDVKELLIVENTRSYRTSQKPKMEEAVHLVH